MCGGNWRFSITSGGNVGVGNSNPQERFHLTGKMRQTDTGNDNNVFYIKI